MRIAIPYASRVSPFDRFIERVVKYVSLEEQAPHGYKSEWSYIVPVGQNLYVEHLYLHLERYSLATSPGRAALYVTYKPVGGSFILLARVTLYSNELYDYKDVYFPSGFVLASGDTLACGSEDASTGGSCLYVANLIGFTFTA